ncbi:MAG: hypothetical protein R3350_04850 [Saprospiraceae bacterium]|nr:hypothetical protein [Saprospiraceae bacterium]
MKNISLLIVALLSIWLAACEKSEFAPPTESDELTEHLSGLHFDFYYSPTDRDTIDVLWQERFYRWVSRELEVETEEKLQYFKYRDRAHIKRMTGRQTSGFAEVGTYNFHTIWKIDNHECVHTLVTQLIGHPPALFNEGIAVAYQANYFKYPSFEPDWNGMDFHRLAGEFVRNGTLPDLEELLGTNSFWNYDPNITYPVSGSFVRFLIDAHGIQKMKQLIAGSDFLDDRGKIKSDFTGVYAISIEQAWNEWMQFIADYQG